MDNSIIIIGLLFLVSQLALFFFINRAFRSRSSANEIKIGINDISKQFEILSALMRDEFRISRLEINQQIKENRAELLGMMNDFRQQLTANSAAFNNTQQANFDNLLKSNKESSLIIESRLEKMRDTVELKLKDIQIDNNAKLEKMRETVDEKLQKTLNDRLGESFNLVNNQLEKVFKGLGDMQKLAVGVGDLKRVLTNVKTRGTMGEVQLESILEQFLSPEQFVKNARIKPNSSEVVEFAVKLPGNDAQGVAVLLPIDSKFPIEDYYRLMELYDSMAEVSKEEVLKAEQAFDLVVKRAAKLISDKYIYPPATTNFGLMFLPTEGLYAQILRRPGLFEMLQRDYNITPVGPSNLVAFLSSLQMGFRTLAVQKHSSEVWQILGAVKSEFNAFEKILVATHKQINQAGGNIDRLIGTRTRVIRRKLHDIQEINKNEASKILGISEGDLIDSE